MAHWLFLPDEAMEDLDALAGLTSDKLLRLRDFLDSSEYRSKYSFFVKVADLLGISDESAARICTFVNYIQKQRIKSAKSGASVPEEIEVFLHRKAEDKKHGSKVERLLRFAKDNRELLVKLFSDLPEHDLSEKVRGLQSGPVPHLANFRAYCDLRPVYDAEADEIVSAFPVITLWISTHSASSDETKEILVQLTEANLEDFDKQFARLRKKLARLKMSEASLVTKKKGPGR